MRVRHPEGDQTLTAQILIVDDEPAAIQEMHNALQGLADMRFATGGTNALALLAAHPFDLVLLDAHMPGLDGFATCRALQRYHPDLHVIFVAASGDRGHELKALEAGALDFVSKPINPPVVRARVQVHLRLKAQTDLLRALSTRDPLTDLANRRALDERVAQEWRRAARLSLPLSLLLADLDHFKAYNDHYGHMQGDDCLRAVSAALTQTVGRAGDFCARFGGEEFAVLLPTSTLTAATALADKICAAVRALGIPHVGSDTALQVTLSIGASTVYPSIPRAQMVSESGREPVSGLHLARALFDAADRALYAAKHAGRNGVAALAVEPRR
jgi:diguanylate cyclase (GGDEF)-like protein